MTTAPDVAVVATHLAQTDRRALSQAWYSALHLAHDDAAPALRARSHGGDPPAAAGMHGRTLPALPARADGRQLLDAPRAARVHAPLRAADALPPERRHPAGDVARRVERAVAALARTPFGFASHTIAFAGGRVTLLVRRDGGSTRIVALCSEPLRTTVERALAHARFALAGRGVTVTAR